MRQLSALGLGISWLMLSVILLLVAALMASLFVIPCNLGQVDCSTVIADQLFFGAFPKADIVLAMQFLTPTLGLLGVASLIAASNMLGFGLFRRHQNAIALGIGFSLLIGLLALLTMMGVERARAWNDWVRGGCEYAFTPVGGDAPTTGYRCAAYAYDCTVDQLDPLSQSLASLRDDDPALSLAGTAAVCSEIAALACRLPDSLVASLPASSEGTPICTAAPVNWIELNRAPKTWIVNQYESVLNSVWLAAVGLFLSSLVLTPGLLVASGNPPGYLSKGKRGRIDVCTTCGRKGADREVPVCVLCRVPYRLHIETEARIYEHDEASIPLTIHLKASDSANASLPLGRMAVQITLPGALEYVEQNQPGWSLASRQRGQPIKLTSPAAFLPVVANEAGLDRPLSATLRLRFRLRTGVQRQLRRVKDYPIEVSVIPLDGLARQLSPAVARIRIRRQAWLL